MAIQLNATDIHLSNTASALISVTGPLTMLAWINYSGWNSGTNASIVGLYLAGTTGIQFGSRGAGDIDIWTWGGGALVSSAGSGYLPTANTWIPIAYTCSGTSHQLYANGNLVSTATATQIAGTLTQFYINGYPTGVTNETSTALVDDVVVYNRVLSAAEIATISTLRGGRHGIVNGIIASYQFDELAIGQTLVSVTDYSGNNRTLTPVGAGTAMTYVVSPIDMTCRPAIC